MPIPLQDLALELFFSILFIAFAFVLYGFSLANPFLAVVVLIGVVGGIVGREMYVSWSIRRDKRRRKAALQAEKDAAKLNSLYGGPEGMDDSLDKSVGMGGVDDVSSFGGNSKTTFRSPPGSSSSIRSLGGNKFTAKTSRVYAIQESKYADDSDSDNEDGEEEYNADGTVMIKKDKKGDEDEEEKIDLIGTFVREMNRDSTFRSKYWRQQ